MSATQMKKAAIFVGGVAVSLAVIKIVTDKFAPQLKQYTGV